MKPPICRRPRRKGGRRWVLRNEFHFVLVVAELSQAKKLISPPSFCLQNTTFAVDCVHLPNTYPNIKDKKILHNSRTHSHLFSSRVTDVGVVSSVSLCRWVML